MEENTEKKELLNSLKYIISLAEKNEIEKLIDFTKSLILQIKLKDENTADEYVENLLKELK